MACRPFAARSTAGLNVIYIEFDWSTEIRAARQTVQERLTTLEGILPEGIRPQMTPPSSIMGQIVIAGIYRQAGPDGGRLAQVGRTDHDGRTGDRRRRPISVFGLATGRPARFHDLEESSRPQKLEWASRARRRSRTARESGWNATLQIDGKPYEANFYSDAKQQLELRTVADWIIRPRLLKTTGVAEVFMQGGDRKQYQILIDPTALLEYDVTVQDVEQALRESNINTSGGFAVTGETERPIRILGSASDRDRESSSKI